MSKGGWNIVIFCLILLFIGWNILVCCERNFSQSSLIGIRFSIISFVDASKKGCISYKCSRQTIRFHYLKYLHCESEIDWSNVLIMNQDSWNCKLYVHQIHSPINLLRCQFVMSLKSLLFFAVFANCVFFHKTFDLTNFSTKLAIFGFCRDCLIVYDRDFSSVKCFWNDFAVYCFYLRTHESFISFYVHLLECFENSCKCEFSDWQIVQLLSFVCQFFWWLINGRVATFFSAKMTVFNCFAPVVWQFMCVLVVWQSSICVFECPE